MWRRWMCGAVVGWAGLAACSACRAGEPTASLWELQLADGRGLTGRVALGEGVLQVEPVDAAGRWGEPVEIRGSVVRSIVRVPAAEAAALLSPSAPREQPERGLLGEYFGDTDLREWLFDRVDPGINFEGRGDAKPALFLPGVPSSFSVRWSGMLVPPVTGEYRFFVSSDDGARVWVNDQVVSDHWGSKVIRDVAATMRLTAGEPVPIRVEYMDVGGGQFFKLEWEAKGQAGTEGFQRREVPAEVMLPPERLTERVWPGEQRRGGWQATYFPGLGGQEPFATRTESTTALEWGSSPPVPGMRTAGGAWSAVVEGRLFPPVAGRYRFRIEVDDRVRLMLDDKVVLDTSGQRRFDHEFEVELPRDRAVRVRAEYENDLGDAYLRLRWRPPGTADWREVPISVMGLPEGEDVSPLVAVDRRTLPGRFFLSEAGDREVHARVWTAGGRPARIEWILGATIVQAGEGPDDGIARLPLSRVPIGQHQLQVRVVDAAGRSATSAAVPLEAEGIEGGVLTGPWRDARVGSSPRRAVVLRTPDGITLAGGPGEVELQADALRLVCRPVGMGEYLEAVIHGVATEGDGYGVGGLMLRESLDAESRFVAVVLDNEGRGRVITRAWGWQPTLSVPVSVGVGARVRLVRESGGVRLLSWDGQASGGSDRPGAEGGRSVWFGPLRFDQRAWGGIFAVSRTGGVTLTAGVPTVGRADAPLSKARGVMLTSGSFLAGEVRLEPARDGREARFVVWHRGRDVSLSPNRVAYVAAGEVPAAAWATAVRQAPCLLMGTEDVLQGELVRLRDNRAEIDTVLFGPRQVNLWGNEGRAVVLGDFRPAPADAVTLRLSDGTAIVGSGLEVSPEGIRVAGAGVPVEIWPVRLDELSERPGVAAKAGGSPSGGTN